MPDRYLKLLAVTALSVGCGGATELPPLPPDPRTVKPQAVVAPPAADSAEEHRRALLEASVTARLRWQAFAPSGYRLVVTQRCHCDAGTPFRSEVQDGRVVSRSGGVRSGERPVLPSLRTVEELFAQARRVIESHADEITVVFDPALGYPSRIGIDLRRSVTDEREWFATLTITRPAPLAVFELAK